MCIGIIRCNSLAVAQRAERWVLQSTGRGFKSYSEQKLRNNLGQVVHTYVPLSLSSITCYRPRSGGALRLEVTAGLAESNGRQSPGG